MSPVYSVEHLISLYSVHCSLKVFFLLQDGSTALHFAASINDIEIIKLLTSHGADITVADKV